MAKGILRTVRFVLLIAASLALAYATAAVIASALRQHRESLYVSRELD